jgi:hypothetical protein
MAFVRDYGFFRTTGSTSTATLSGLTFTVGDLACIVIWWYNNLTDAITVADSAGNTWTKVPGTFQQNPNTGQPYLGAQIWTAPITNGGSGITITATFPSTAFYPAMAGCEFSGRDNASPIDSHASAQGNGVASSGNLTTLTAGCDLFGAVYDDTGTITGQGSGWSVGSLGFNNYLSEERAGVSIGSYAATSNSSSTVQYNAQVVALKAPFVAPPPKPVVCIMQ